MEFTLTMPEWAIEAHGRLPSQLATVHERMAIVIAFSRRNFEAGTGGPFAAGVFERDTGTPVAIGVNRVVASNCSSAHAEVMAISLAQQRLGAYDLGGPGQPAHQLVVNWRPCAMCLGATIWSGVRSLAIAGSGPELEEITGFDEGPAHPEWRRELEERGIDVIDGVLTNEAIAVYRDFAASSSPVYNPRSRT